ncbi:rhomboid-related protein 2 [Aplysia californica]|uniref:Rhomboid-related protein 2 n=1 Tax=Aplysia californica TaxID=6500 RepID=A0ABM0ZUZ5_APLCA|nr:rhomboid-related protein 2 [Aplysia californica]
MSRWREMLMDYGQLLDQGSIRKSRGTASDFFSVDGDLMERNKAERGLREVLERHFRPLFQRFVYGGEKIACHDLQRLLRDPFYRDLLPPERVNELSDLVDFNMGRSVTYTEFVRIVMGRQYADDSVSFGSLQELSDSRSNDSSPPVLATVCRNTLAQEEVLDHVTKYKCCPPAFFMIAITIAQIVVYFMYTGDSDYGSIQPLEGIPTTNYLWYIPDRRREAWRFVSYCLMHEGFVDLLFNVVLQLAFGIPLEIMFSFWRVMILYICGVVVASLGHSVCDRYYGLAGAAGGCYAVLAAHVLSMIMNWKNLNNNKKESGAKRILCSVTLRIIIILILVAAQIALAVYRRWGVDDPKVGIAAHVGGIVTGKWVLG